VNLATKWVVLGFADMAVSLGAAELRQARC
jgi:hypothetical protein